MATAYKIGVNVPAGTEQTIMDALDGCMEPLYPGYEHVFSWWPVRGCWRPVDGARPYLGEVGELEVADEVRIEFAVREGDVGRVVRRIAEVHPYEEPAIDVIPMVPWKDLAA